MQNRLDKIVDSNKITLNFGQKGEKGLKELYYGKGAIFSLTCLFVISLFFVLFFFLLPFELESVLIVCRLFILLASLFIFYLFHKSVIEILVEEDYVRLRTFRKYREVLIKEIQSIKVYNFTTWGIATIYLKSNKSDLYTLWVPSFERERYESFLKFVEFLEEISEGNFQFDFRT